MRRSEAGKTSSEPNQTGMPRLLALFVVVAATLIPVRAPALPAAAVVATLWHYTPGDVDEPRLDLTVEQGGTVTFTNAEILLDSHSMTAVALDENGSPLFDSGIIPPGLTMPVRGVSRLPRGTYDFFCGLHLSAMVGRLTVV